MSGLLLLRRRAQVGRHLAHTYNFDGRDKRSTQSERPRKAAEKEIAYDIKPTSSPVYRSLPSPDHIRILRLQGGDEKAPLVANLVSIPFGEAKRSYEALSYVWGSEKATELLYCNNEAVISVRPNLASALRRLRPASGSRDLWIDYLCIDQENNEERGEQMRFMHEIYGCASRVLTWIGEKDETSDMVMDYISTLDPAISLLEFDDWKRSFRVQNPTQHVLERDDEAWTKAVSNFLSRPWFRRVWIQQEAAVCSNTVVLCGDRTVTWNQLYAFSWMASLGGAFTANVDRHWRLMSPESQTAIKLVRTIQSMRKRPDGKNTSPTLLHVLNMTRRAESSHHRDRVFAVQHLAKQQKGSEVVVDPVKQRDWKAVFEELAVRYLHRRGPAILSYAGRSAQTNHDLPSWVPDWTHKPYSRIMGAVQWKAGGPTRGYRIPKHPIKVQDPKVLLIGGFLIGEITRLSNYNLDIESGESYEEIEANAYSMIDEGAVYFTGEGHVEAYLGTLLAGNQYKYTGQLGRRDALKRFWEWRSWLHTNGNIEQMYYDVTIENTGTFVDKRFGFAGDFMCLVPALTRVGDKICLIQALHRPMVVREKGDNYEFIGECYVHGIMNGQKWDASRCEVMQFC